MKNKILSAIVVCSSLLLVQGMDSTVTYTHGIPSSNRRIINGENANPLDYLFVVQLYVDQDSNVMLCSGSIISAYFILTAAHCIYYLPCNLIQIYPSTWEPGDIPEIHTAHCYPHEQFNGGFFFFDIGLVKTVENLLVSGQLKRIDLAKSNTIYQPGDHATIVGWGITEDKIFPAQLLRARMEVDTWDHCNEEYQNAQECTDHMNCPAPEIPHHAMCTIGRFPRYSTTCIGDAGGPTIIDGVLAAIVSGSIMENGGCRGGSPSLAIKVSNFLPWIATVIQTGNTSQIPVAEKFFYGNPLTK